MSKMQTISFCNDMEAMWVRELAWTSLPRLWRIHTVCSQFDLIFDIGYTISSIASAFALASCAISSLGAASDSEIQTVRSITERNVTKPRNEASGRRRSTLKTFLPATR